jgi:hypothetical protein
MSRCGAQAMLPSSGWVQMLKKRGDVAYVETSRRGGETVINICRITTVDASDFVQLRQITVGRG